MPLTGRPDSYAPAELVEKAFRIHPQGAARWRLNNATHLALGTMWGAAYGVAARAGLRGPRAVRGCSGLSTRVTSCSTRARTLPTERVVPSGLDRRHHRQAGPGGSNRCHLRPVAGPGPPVLSVVSAFVGT
jgi:hypothetical protein